MTARVRILMALAASISLLGCAAGAPKPQWATAADMPELATFGWATQGSAERPLTILDTQVRTALAAQLTRKGYAESADAPDFRMSYELVTYEKNRSSNPVRIGIGVGTWGGHVGGSVGTSVGLGGSEDPKVRAQLQIHAVATESNREVWTGTTTTFGPGPDAATVERAVAGVMQGFPQRGR
ncbi:MAG: DUF4136 domain-containing protein [Pseudomonadales bacterium]